MRTRLAFPLFLLAIAGCGGGGSPGTEVGGDQTMSMGGVTASYSRAGSNLKPAVSSQTNGVLVTGLAGANFTKIMLNGSKHIQDTQIAFDYKGGIYLTNIDGSGEHQVLEPTMRPLESAPSWYPGGGILVLARFDTSSNLVQIFRCNEDGSGLARLTNMPANALHPSWTTNGSKIVFTSYEAASSANQLYTMKSDGSALTKISDGTTQDYNPTWSADGNTIYFIRLVLGSYHLYTMNANGTGVAFVSGTQSLSTLFSYSVSPSGNLIAYDSAFSGLMIFSSNGYQVLETPPSGYTDTKPTFSPDGKQIAFVRTPTSAPGSFLCIMNNDGTNVRTVDTGGEPLTSLSWGPFPGARVLVGTGGAFGTAASGFLMAQGGTMAKSFVTFTTTSPGTATITLQSPSGNVTDSAFQVTGDSITSLRYANDVQVPPTTIVPSSAFASAKGALVEFDSVLGEVAMVVPYTSSKRTVTKQGTQLYEGKFLGIWNASGKNVAPLGATAVEIGSGGKLISFR